MSSIKVTQVRSVIGVIPKHRGTMRALGLRKIGSSNILPDRADVRGMIAQVPYLIKVESVDTEPTPARRHTAKSPAPMPASGSGAVTNEPAPLAKKDA